MQKRISSCFLCVQVKEEGWYLIAGDPSTHELLALKRVGLEDRTTVKLQLPRFNGAGQLLQETTIYFMSDSYIGLDQQYTVELVPGLDRSNAGSRKGGSMGGGGVGRGAGVEAEGGLQQRGGGVEERRARRAVAAAERAAERKALSEMQLPNRTGNDAAPVAMGPSELREGEWDDEPGCG
jgi:hypothetical protein